jgi:hypothetical protein
MKPLQGLIQDSNDRITCIMTCEHKHWTEAQGPGRFSIKSSITHIRNCPADPINLAFRRIMLDEFIVKYCPSAWEYRFSLEDRLVYVVSTSFFGFFNKIKVVSSYDYHSEYLFFTFSQAYNFMIKFRHVKKVFSALS